MNYSWISFSVGVNMKIVNWKNTHQIQNGGIQDTWEERMPGNGEKKGTLPNTPVLL